jgi:hypothetical protein
MSARHRPTTPEARFARAIEDRTASPEPQYFVIPTLAADPPDGDPTNLWMRWDGRLRGRYLNGSGVWVYVDYPMRSDITSPPAVPAYPAAPALASAPLTYQNTYTATWSQGYKGDGTKRTDAIGETMLPFGNRNDGNGTQRSLIGFDYSTIATDLAASTITGVQLRLVNLDSYWSRGVDIFFGIHNEPSEPTSWNADNVVASRIASAHFGKPETKTIPLTLEFATRLRAGTGKGIAIEAPSSAIDLYGYASGVGSAYDAPQLVITFAK